MVLYKGREYTSFYFPDTSMKVKHPNNRFALLNVHHSLQILKKLILFTH